MCSFTSFHQEHNIQTESWSPLFRAKDSDLFSNDALQDIAHKHNKTVSHVILRWHYQLGSIAIPKSASPERQLENISIFDFELDNTEMNTISRLTRPDGRIQNQDPAVYEEF